MEFAPQTDYQKDRQRTNKIHNACWTLALPHHRAVPVLLLPLHPGLLSSFSLRSVLPM